MIPENANVATLAKEEVAPRPAAADNIVPKKIRILGIPLDLGQTRRGVDMGPSAVRVPGWKRGWKHWATLWRTAATSQ